MKMNLEDKEYFKKLKEEYPYTPDKDILNAILKEKEATREHAEKLKNKIQCENCIYFQKAESISQIMAGVGHCQRYPPRNISPELNPEEFGPEDIALSVPDFPLVYKTDWCGEFKPKKGIKTKVEQTPNNQLSKKGVPKMRDFVRRAIFRISLSNKHPINGHKNTTGDKSLALFGHSSHYSYLPSLHSKYNNNNIDSHNSDEVKT